MNTAREGIDKIKDKFLTNGFNIKNHKDIIFAIGVIGIIIILIFPIPTWLVDLLLSISIALSVLVLMTVLFIDKSLEFNSFPTILLVVTMLRLSLNISTTRLILSNGHNGYDAAGHVVKAFGSFVMQGSVVIGAIVFGILTIINFVVITKGSGRIAEVAARFSLDAMPGKQMAIDADLSAGLIDEEAARTRRKDLEDENTFFGAMDGANKFVRGDAVAGLLITFINFIGGIIIGMAQMDMDFAHAANTYTFLTIGDGLVSQIPALVVSTSAGLLVTKSGDKGSAEKAILDQVGSNPQALGVTSGILGFMAVMPGIPAIPFFIAASILGIAGFVLYNNRNNLEVASQAAGNKMKAAGGQQIDGQGGDAQQTELTPEEALAQALKIDMIRLELGYELLPLVNYQKGKKITDQIRALRQQIAKDLGFVIPSVRIQDNLQMDADQYTIRVKDIECGSGNIKPDKLLVMQPSGKEIEISGEDTVEPAFGLAARWIDENKKEEALFKEYTVVDPPTVITTHLTEIIKDNIMELLSYTEVKKLLAGLSEDHKKLSDDIIPAQITATTLQRILQSLLSEAVSIRDLPTILEAISELNGITSNMVRIVEHIRMRLAKQICHANTTDKGYIPLVTLSPVWEQAFSESLVGADDDKQLAMSPTRLQEFVGAVNQTLEKFTGFVFILLTLYIEQNQNVRISPIKSQ